MGGGPGKGRRGEGRGHRAGLGVLLPGYPQWRWRQRERALVLGGTFGSALAVGLFAWGTPLGLSLLGVAFFCHVASVADAMRQVAFPGFARGVPTLSTSLGLGLGCYGPLLVVATVVAWPGARRGRRGSDTWSIAGRIRSKSRSRAIGFIIERRGRRVTVWPGWSLGRDRRSNGVTIACESVGWIWAGRLGPPRGHPGTSP